MKKHRKRNDYTHPDIVVKQLEMGSSSFVDLLLANDLHVSLEWM